MSGGAFLIACLNFASHSLERTDPRIALRLDPLNTDARLALIAGGLSAAGVDGATLVRFRKTAAAGLALAPVEGRLWSVAGAIESRMGNDAAAEADFDRALAVSRTEINALLNVFDIAAARGDYARAIDCADIVFRRWAGRSAKVQAALLAIASDPAGYAVLRERLIAGPPWRDRLLSAFATGPKAAATGAALAIDLAASGHAAAPSAVSALERALIRFKMPDEAYRLFLLTRTDAQGAQAGFVFDGRFRLAPDGNPFGWRLDGQSGYEVARVPAGGLSLRFFDAPVTRLDVGQTLALPPGDYRLEAQVAASAARFPEGLSWTVRCLAGSQPVARLGIPEGSYATRLLTARFSIGGDCALQTLQLATGLAVDSWQYRYSGQLTFDSISIAQAGSQ